MTTIVQTENSNYELDYPNKRVRRITGSNRPTPRQGIDGTWREFLSVYRMDGGLLFVWNKRDSDGVLECTLTSLVVDVTGDEIPDEEPESPPDNPWPGYPDYDDPRDHPTSPRDDPQ